DATCPLVTKVHKEAQRFASQDRDIVLIGHIGHEEVDGTSGGAPARIHIVESPGEVDKAEVRDPDNVSWLSRPTLSVDEPNRTGGALPARFPNSMDPTSDGSCAATSNRPEAVKAMAPACELVIVVGSDNSSNSF